MMLLSQVKGLYISNCNEDVLLVFVLLVDFNPGPAEPGYTLPLQTV